MSTYVIVDVNYNGRGPQPHIVYAGNDCTFAVETFRRMFNDIAVVNGTCPKVPSAYWPYKDKDLAKNPEYVLNEPSANDVFDYMMEIFKYRGYVDLNSDWLKNYDYYQDPFYIRFDDGNNKLAKPLDFDKLPEADKKRIRDRLSAAKDKRLEEYDTYFRNSPYKVIYEFFKEHGTVKPSHDYQYYNCHDINFECDIEIEVPKKDRTLTKRTVNIHGYIEDWYKDEFNREHGAEIKIILPFHYATDKGKFPSWADAIKAGSNIKYGGSCNVGEIKSASELKEGDRYGYYASKMTKEDLKPIEKILLNIESDNQQFLKDCHYKD